MAAVTGLERRERTSGEAPARAAARTGASRWLLERRWWRLAVLGVVGVYFLVPLFAALRFTIEQPGGGLSVSAYSGLLGQQGFSAAFGLTLRLALVTTVLTLVLLVPTGIYVHLRLPGLRRVMDVITTLPIVIPPIVLVIGVLQVAPPLLKATPYLLALEYVVLALPFAYRSLDAGLSAIDHATLVDAARSLGASWRATFARVLLPNLRTALLSGTVLTVALVLGEFTMASLDQYQTFSVWIVAFDQNSSRVSVAASLLALVVTWAFLLAISLLGTNRRRRRGAGRVAAQLPAQLPAQLATRTGKETP